MRISTFTLTVELVTIRKPLAEVAPAVAIGLWRSLLDSFLMQGYQVWPLTLLSSTSELRRPSRSSPNCRGAL